MPPSKPEQVEKLMRALFAREAELKANEDLVQRATLRSQSLRAAIADLRATIASLLGEAAQGTDDRAPTGAPDTSSKTPEMVPRPGLARTGGTILVRILAYLDATPRVSDARTVAQALDVNIDVVRTTLSKLHARGFIARPQSGQYCSLQYAQEIAPSVTRRTK
jgi:hypothetical protein